MVFLTVIEKEVCMIRKLKDARTNKRKNLGTFNTLEAAKKHEREVQYFKHG
jgi:hypothetical protein